MYNARFAIDNSIDRHTYSGGTQPLVAGACAPVCPTLVMTVEIVKVKVY